MDYPDMPNFSQFVAEVWTSDYAKSSGGSPRELIRLADEAATQAQHQVAQHACGTQPEIEKCATDAGGPKGLAPHEGSAYLRQDTRNKAARTIAAQQVAQFRDSAGDTSIDPVGKAAGNAATARGSTSPTSADAALVAASDAWTVALRQFGVDVPPNRIVYVHRNTPTEYHYVIPERPATDPFTLQQQAMDAIPHAMTCN